MSTQKCAICTIRDVHIAYWMQHNEWFYHSVLDILLPIWHALALVFVLVATDTARPTVWGSDSHQPRREGCPLNIPLSFQNPSLRHLQMPAMAEASLVVQMVRNPPTLQVAWVWSLGQEDPLENPMDREEPLATVHRVTKSWTWLKWLSTHARMAYPTCGNNISDYSMKGHDYIQNIFDSLRN